MVCDCYDVFDNGTSCLSIFVLAYLRKLHGGLSHLWWTPVWWCLWLLLFNCSSVWLRFSVAALTNSLIGECGDGWREVIGSLIRTETSSESFGWCGAEDQVRPPTCVHCPSVLVWVWRTTGMMPVGNEWSGSNDVWVNSIRFKAAFTLPKDVEIVNKRYPMGETCEYQAKESAKTFDSFSQHWNWARNQ